MDSIWQQALDPWEWLVLVHLLFWLAISARVLLRSDLSPDVRVAWLLVLLLLPYGGVLLYFLFGEVYLGRALARQQKAVLKNLRLAVTAHHDWRSLWQLAAAIMQRQREYCALAQVVQASQVQSWGRLQRIWNNAWAALSPLL